MNKPMTLADGLTRSRFSAGLLPEGDRIAIWREIFGRTNIRLDMEPLSDEPFHCECEALSLPDISVAWGSSSAFSGTRTRELLSDNRHDISLILPMRGTAWAAQSGEEVEISEGEAVLLHTSRTGPVHFPRGSDYINVCVPESALAPLVPRLEGMAMTVIPASSEPLRLLLGYCQLLRKEHTPSAPETARIVATHFHDLIAAAINSTRDLLTDTESQGLRIARLRALKADIAENAHAADMTIDAVAKRLQISPRYVRKLLAGENTTFSELVLNERLSRAFRMLSDPRRIHRSICAIAFDVGFGDLSYFNRTFRRRFGATPSEIRGASSKDGPHLQHGFD